MDRGDKSPKRLLRPKVVEQRYDLSEGYQAKLRCAGEGPEYIKIGSRVFYEEEAIERWLATKRRTSTSDKGEVLSANPVAPGRKTSQQTSRRVF